MHISEKMMQQMAILRREQSEVGYVIAAIRERGDPLAANLDTELLKREVVATLAACDRVGHRKRCRSTVILLARDHNLRGPA